MSATGTGIALRGILPTEVDSVMSMAREIWPAAYGQMISAEQIDYMLGWMYAPQRLLAEITDGIAYRWIVRDGERIGFAAFGPVRHGAACPLHKCYLLPSSQGYGAGSEAMVLLCAEAAAAGATRLDLRVNRHNTPAIGFYLKNGFAITGEDCLDIGGDFAMDDYLMGKPLAATQISDF